jgi:peptidoglycan/LPS O-acetylase OafA/YrhL
MFSKELTKQQPARWTALGVGLLPLVCIFSAGAKLPVRQKSRLPSWVFVVAWVSIGFLFVFNSLLLVFNADVSILVAACVFIALFTALAVLWLFFNYRERKDKSSGIMVALLFTTFLLYSLCLDVGEKNTSTTLACTNCLVLSWVIAANILAFTEQNIFFLST